MCSLIYNKFLVLACCPGIKGIKVFGTCSYRKIINSNSASPQAISHDHIVDNFPTTAHPPSVLFLTSFPFYLFF